MNVIRWMLWSPRRAGIGLVAAVVVGCLAVGSGATLASWVRYQRALDQYEVDVAAYEAQQAAAGTAEPSADETAAGITLGSDTPALRVGDDTAGGSDGAAEDHRGGGGLTVGSGLPSLAPGVAGVDDHDSGSAEEVAAATDAAVDFTAAFHTRARYGDNPAEWVAELTPLVNAGLLNYLEAVPADAVPAAQVSGVRYAEVGVYTGTVVVELDTAAALEVIVVSQPDGSWQVTDYRPADA